MRAHVLGLPLFALLVSGCFVSGNVILEGADAGDATRDANLALDAADAVDTSRDTAGDMAVDISSDVVRDTANDAVSDAVGDTASDAVGDAPADVADEDAGATDAAVDVRADTRVCTSRADCDDGVYCNGDEQCKPGMSGSDAYGCMPGTPPCTTTTVQQCFENLRGCYPSDCATPDMDGDGSNRSLCGGSDCNDNNAAVHPGASEVCNGIDDNCDGMTDEGVAQIYYYDPDGDGYGQVSTVPSCTMPTGTVARGGDCNEQYSGVHPGASESCDGLDDDCNGTIDDGLTQRSFCLDNDGDGYGGSTTELACAAPPSYTTQCGDCDDTNEMIYPGNGCP